MQTYCLKGIITRYLGCTNTKGSRVKAVSESGLAVTLEWDDALNPWNNHQAAARALVAKLEWGDFDADWIGGAIKDGYAFVRRPT